MKDNQDKINYFFIKDFDVEVYRQLKIIAATEGIPLEALIRSALADYVENWQEFTRIHT